MTWTTAVSGWKPDLLVTGFARLVNSGVALLYSTGGKERPPTVISSAGLGATRQEIAHPGEEGSLAARCIMPAQRAALESLDPVLDARLIHTKDRH